MATRVELREAVSRRLSDPDRRVWAADEIDEYLQIAYRELALTSRVFADWVYLENLPRSFSYTAAWEKLHGYVDFDAGLANYTMADERRLLTEADRIGWANYTSPWEATRGHLEDSGASTAIPATADLPDTVTEVDRALWDTRAIDALNPSTLARSDTRFEVTEGEVYGYVWRQDGVRTFRKIRVPAAQAATHTIDGSWGLLRTPTDLDATTPTGTWGICRQVPGEHPIGYESFGFPRRPYRDGTNVRVEHWRTGRPMDLDEDPCELPDRYAQYLRHYAQGRCLSRNGPGQDVPLGAHYLARWSRDLARIGDRLTRRDQARVGRLGGDQRPSIEPPRPSWPWSYGSVVRR